MWCLHLKCSPSLTLHRLLYLVFHFKKLINCHGSNLMRGWEDLTSTGSDPRDYCDYCLFLLRAQPRPVSAPGISVSVPLSVSLLNVDRNNCDTCQSGWRVNILCSSFVNDVWCRDYKYSKLHKTWRHRHLSPQHILKAACISVYLYIDSYCLMQSGMRLLNVSISLFVVTVFEIIIWSVRLETDQAASAVWNINCYLRAILDV